MLDLITIWSYPSSSNQLLQADTPACCSSSQKQVEVLLFSWPVRHCLDSTVRRPVPPLRTGWLALGGCRSLCHSCWHRGEAANCQGSNKASVDLNTPSQCVWKYNWRQVQDCCQHSLVCLWIGHRCPSAEMWLCLQQYDSAWLAHN